MTVSIDPELQAHINSLFDPLNNLAAVNAFPPPSALSQALSALLPVGSKQATTRNVSLETAKLFATAAVNMWMRAVHSFLVSASLTDISPIWASVAGYYSSHYAVRATAHLLGFSQLFARRRIVRLEVQGRRYVCTFDPKATGDREHRFYWRIVKKDPHFAGDAFFTENAVLGEKSPDVAHRDHASYADHLPQFPTFRPLDKDALKSRIDRISEIEFSAPPIPQVSRYPDIEAVQIVAYHRLVRFRDLLDAILGDKNRFWNIHRIPSWAREFMDFQLTPEGTLRSQFTL